MCATDHSCSVSLHSAKATGRPRSTCILPFAREHILELDVAEKGLRFRDEIVDRLMTVTAARGGSGRLDRSCRLLCTDQR